jgi:hypothetical protein
MILIKYSDLVKAPIDILLCGIPVRVFLSPRNTCNAVVRLSCVHKFEDSHGTDVEICTGQTYAFSYNGKEEELRVGRQFIIVDS